MKAAKVADSVVYLKSKAYLADCIDYKDGIGTFIQKNKLTVGEAVEVISPGKTGVGFTVTAMYDEKGEQIESCPHPYMVFKMPVPFEIKAGDIIRA